MTTPFMPTVNLSPDALVSIAGGEVVTWEECLRRLQGWRPIETAPKDGTPVLGWCVHDADPYFIEPEGKDGRSRLTIYGAHTEGLSHVEDGAHVIVWGGSWDDSTHEYSGGWMPDWWFRADSEFEVTANPTHWMPIPAAPIDTGREG